MNGSKNKQNDLDAVCTHIRENTLDDRQVEESAGRVWEGLKAEALQNARSQGEGHSREQSGVPSLLDLSADGSSTRHGSLGIEGCEDFRSLLPAYHSRILSAERRLLIEDHVRECVDCRRALKELREGRRTPEMSGPLPVSRSIFSFQRLALAALILIALGLAGTWGSSLFRGPSGPVATVASIRGSLLHVGGRSAELLSAGSTVDARERVRTTRNSSAVVRLNDGSRIEMGPRAELSVRAVSEGQAIQLERGHIIVHAAKQRQGALHVLAPDADVRVTGTVFSVLSGLKGSLVSVLEGDVQVTSDDVTRVLHPGEQLSTSSSVESSSNETRVAWSEEAGAYQSMMSSLEQVDADLTASSSVRYDTRLLDLMPASSALYLSVPNIGVTLSNAYDLIKARIESSEALNTVFAEKAGDAEMDAALEVTFERLRELSSAIGSEVAVSMTVNDQGKASGLLALATVTSEADLRAAIEPLLDAADRTDSAPSMRYLDSDAAVREAAQESADTFSTSGSSDALTASGSSETFALTLGLSGGMLAVSTSPSLAGQALLRASDAESSPFIGTGFYKKIAEAYDGGVGWLVAADFGLLMTGVADSSNEDSGLLEDLGLLDMDYLVADYSTEGQRTEYHAALTFDRERRGLASWIATPTALAGMDFVSPQATFAGGMVFRDPATFLGEFLDVLDKHHGDVWEKLDAFEDEQRIRLLEDIAGPLGGEIVVALDGPLLPEPAWKVIFEVYDPETLLHTLSWAVDRINENNSGSADSLAPDASADESEDALTAGSAEGIESDDALTAEVGEGSESDAGADDGSESDAGAGDRSETRLILSQAEYAGLTVYSLDQQNDQLGSSKSLFYFAFVDGYAIVAPNRVLIENAVYYRDSATTLARSSTFRDMLPEDGYTDFSGLLYQNLAPVLGNLSEHLSTLTGGDDGSAVLPEDLSSAFKPTLVGVYGEKDRILVAGAGETLPSASQIESFLRLGGMVAEIAGRSGTVSE